MNIGDIGAWLRGLNLEQYEGAFRENDIDAEVLSEVTADDLVALGITSVGHRRKLLAAIAALKSEPMHNRAIEQTSTASSSSSQILTGAERRYLTVLFCDLVGSTALASKRDPEDVRELLGSYHSAVSQEVARFDGFVAKFMGDGVLAYFGYPKAHEDDAERAIRTALSLTDRIGTLNTATGALAVRIGIATGLVVVGDLIGSGEAQERGIVGETPNLAARLQGLAEPNGVLITGPTRQLVGDLFEYRDLGVIEIKGFDEGIPIWQVLGASGVESRFEALRAASLSPLVGREEEVGLLLRRWQLAKRGEGQIVLISGEPGIGKSRLTVALQEKLHEQPYIPLRYFCSPHHRDSPLYPFIAQIERAAGFVREDLPESKLDKLQVLLRQSGEHSAESISAFADLLGVPTESRYPPGPSDPQRRRELILATLLDELESRSKHQPVLMIFEDAHWADSSSLELLDRTAERLSRLSVLMVITHRPEFVPPWIGQAHVTSVILSRLANRDTTALVTGITGGKSLPAEILDRIVERTDGIPLFAEELTKTLLESGLLREEGDSYTLTRPLPPLAIPTSLQASLLARLDRLMPVKEVAQIGAALGREFSYELLAAVARHNESELREALDHLTNAGLIFRRGVPPRATYTFKHALVQDAAYSTLLRGPRQDLHARIAKVLQDRFAETAEAQPEILAHHYTQAGLVDLAIEFWRSAGANSVRRSAHSEAVNHFENAINLLATSPRGNHDERELEIMLASAVPLIAVHGFGSSRVEHCALRAKELAEKSNDSPNRFAALRLAWNSCLMRQPVPKTLAMAQDLMALADSGNDPAKLAVAHRALGYSLFIAGELRASADALAKGVALADTLMDGEFAVYGEHPSMVCRIYGGQTKVLMGFPDSGVRLVEEGIAHARRQSDIHSLTWALGVASHVSELQHEAARTVHFGTEVIHIAQHHRLPQWLALGERCKGWAMHQLGDLAAGLALQQNGVKRWYETGAMLHTTHCEIILAKSYLREGCTTEARSCLSAARSHRAQYGEDYLAAEIERLEALLLHLEGANFDIIDEHLTKALTIARAQEARLLELRSATMLARMLAETGDRRRAIDLLAPIYGWFTEGFDTTDLREAKAVLDKLS